MVGEVGTVLEWCFKTLVKEFPVDSHIREVSLAYLKRSETNENGEEFGYWEIFKEALKTDDYKVHYTILSSLSDLIKHDDTLLKTIDFQHQTVENKEKTPKKVLNTSLRSLFSHEYRNDQTGKRVLDEIVDSVFKCYDIALSSDLDKNAEIVLQVIKVMHIAYIKDNIPLSDEFLDHMFIVCVEVYLYAAKPELRDVARDTLLEICKYAIFKLEKSYDNGNSIHEEHSGKPEDGDTLLLSQVKLIFDNLVKSAAYSDNTVSIKKNFDTGEPVFINNKNIPSYIRENNIKVMASELLIVCISKVGPNTRSRLFFLDFIKNDCFSVFSKNLNTPHPQLFRINCTIFSLLISSYRNILKKEIELGLGIMYMHILENAAYYLWKKTAVISSIVKLCENPCILVDIYYNYDCNLEFMSLFEKIVDACCKICQSDIVYKDISNIHESVLKSVKLDIEIGDIKTQELRIKNHALTCLHNILKSILILNKNSQHDNISSTTFHANHDAIESSIYRKSILMKDVKIFNVDPIEGIKQLINHEFIENEPESIASFLFNFKGLSKISIGEYIGKNNKLSLSTMKSFILHFDFKGKKLIESLRMLLSSFRIPGEAQIIDRILQQFSEHYFNSNINCFPTPDAVYTLSFSIIMLNTDLHSPRIKVKMTSDQFINNHKNLPNISFQDDLLASVYEEVKNDEIRQFETFNTNVISHFSSKFCGVNRNLFSHPNSNLSINPYNHEDFNKTYLNSNSTIPLVCQTLSKHMFQSCLWPMNVAFNVLCEFNDEKYLNNTTIQLSHNNNVDFCIYTYTQCIYICAIMKMDEEKNALVNSLSKLINFDRQELLTFSGYMALCAIVYFANNYGNYLGSSWTSVMVVILQLYNLNSKFGKITTSDYTILYNKDSTSTEQNNNNYSTIYNINVFDTKSNDIQHSPVKMEEINNSQTKYQDNMCYCEYEAFNAFVPASQLLSNVEHIFTGSRFLEYNAVIDLIHSLCSASLIEIGFGSKNKESTLVTVIKLSNTQSKTLLLQKIVEVVFYNMERDAHECTKISLTVSKYFERVLIHKNIDLVKIALDSLKQVSLTLIQNSDPKFDSSSYQTIILSVFKYAAEKFTSAYIIQNLILILNTIIYKSNGRITSAWSEIISTLLVIIERQEEYNNNFTSDILGVIHLIFELNYYEAIVDNGNFYMFIDLISSLIMCTQKKEDDELVNNCAKSFIKATSLFSSYFRDKVKLISAEENSDVYQEVYNSYNFSRSILSIVSTCCKTIFKSDNSKYRLASFEALSVALNLISTNGTHIDWMNIQEYIIEATRNFIYLQPNPCYEEQIQDTHISPEQSDTSLSIIHSFLNEYLNIFSASFENIIKYENGYIFKSLLDSFVDLMHLGNSKLLDSLTTLATEVIKYNCNYYIKHTYLWEILNDSLKKIHSITLPSELNDIDYNEAHQNQNTNESNVEKTENNNNSPKSFTKFDLTVSKCTSHLNFIHFMDVFLSIPVFVNNDDNNNLIFKFSNSRSSIYENTTKDSDYHVRIPFVILFPDYFIDTILSLFLKSYEVAFKFNKNYELRLFIHTKKFISPIPNLFKQEYSAFSGYIKALIYNINGYLQGTQLTKNEAKFIDYLNLFINYSIESMRAYIKSSTSTSKSDANQIMWGPLIVSILNQLTYLTSFLRKNNDNETPFLNYIKASSLTKNMYDLYEISLKLADIKSLVISKELNSFMHIVGTIYIKPNCSKQDITGENI